MGIIVTRIADFWRHPGPEQTDTSHDLYKVFLKDVIAAVDKGNCEALDVLQEEAQINCWGSIESLQTVPPLLCRAAAKGRKQVIKYLLELGVNADETDTSGMTPLHHACRGKRTDCMRLLLSKAREIDRRDVWGRTPLIKALVYRGLEAAELLLEKGANPNAVDIYGMTPVTTAIDYNLTDILRTLVSHGADVNQVNQHSFRWSGPPLYLAINNQNTDMVNELLRLGATTVPRLQDYTTTRPSGGLSWSYLQFTGGTTNHHVGLTPTLTHSNAVSMAMAELMKRGHEHIDNDCQGMEILMALLSAHGHPLGPSPDVLVRVLINSRPSDFSMLLHKLQVCSSSCQDGMVGLGQTDRGGDATSAGLRLQRQQQQVQEIPNQQAIGNNNNNNNDEDDDSGNNSSNNSSNSSKKKIHRRVTSLQNQARRVVRKSVMRSGRNVVWATKRLQCPPALKSLILLRDIDRAYSPPSPRFTKPFMPPASS